MNDDEMRNMGEDELERFQRFEGRILGYMESIYPAQMAILSHAEIQTLLRIWIAFVITALAARVFFF
jgi:hypothetical protein